ncbi:MAG: hypothetical protein ABSD40_23580 [Streptosporangiaceae bacterium]|jgi:hypothetical protein
MEGPSERLREYVEEQTTEVETEEQLEELLGVLENELTDDQRTGIEDADDSDDLLASVHAWAGLASYAVSRFYAPASPWPRRVGGWGKRAVLRLQRIANRLLPALRAAVGALGAASFSISISFPWGIAIGIGW